MHTHKILLLLAAWLPTLSVLAQPVSVFERYFDHARQFAEAFPREKVHLHFDNTSYYQGDTIWFKAYVVDAATLRPTAISKPLYVELVDQLGNIHERQIVKLTDGEGAGQISLANTFFTGYYEVRAYTKWMLTFGDDVPYFSRTFPIYRKRLSPDEPRSIANYHMDKSMKQRPTERGKALEVRFFPEGGQLVEGIATTVGFEALSRDSGWVDVSGRLLSADGQPISPIATIHHGMGSFVYTPTRQPATAEVDYHGKTHRFALPQAKASGYGLRALVRTDAFEVTMSRSATTLVDSLALFVFAQGVPCSYVPIQFGGELQSHVKVKTSFLPAGVVRLALIHADGHTVADRFCFVHPHTPPTLQAETDKPAYAPYDDMGLRLRLTDAQGAPMAGRHVSVSVRDAMTCDYLRHGPTIATDLLLTSDLRGYIDRPDFYVADQSASRRRMLDNLLLIRGWRSYDLEQAVGIGTFAPRYLPEDRLTLYGRIKSWYGKDQKNIGVTILAQNDTVSIAGTTRTDSLGFFQVSIDDFYGTMESLIQTRRDGKQMNRNTNVSIYRTFEPTLRPYDPDELQPQWDELPSILKTPPDTVDTPLDDSPYDTQLLGEVVVNAKNRQRDRLRRTEAFERKILAYYNIHQAVERMRDEGKTVTDDLGYLLYKLNPTKINREGTRYGVDTLLYSINGGVMKDDVYILRGSIDLVRTAMLYQDQFGKFAYSFDTDNYRVNEEEASDLWGHTNFANDTIDYGMHTRHTVRCDVTMDRRWNPNKSYSSAHGIRRTDIQGYSVPAAFYSPRYPEGGPTEVPDDRRRTLYWNPTLTTDEHGEIHILCNNSRNGTVVEIEAEAMADGQPISLRRLSSE